MNIPIVIQLVKKNNCELSTFIGDNLELCLQKIVLYLKQNLDMNIDYPDNIDDFTPIYLDNCLIKTHVFDYKIFINNDWTKPWTDQEIYEKIIEIIHNIDVQDSILNPTKYSSDNEEEIII